MRLKPLFYSLLLLATPCLADDQTEEVVVTGIRASQDEGMEIPAITLKKPADYFVQTVKLINDSRAPDLRKKEILDTISHIISASGKNKGIEVSYGKGFLEPVKMDDETLQIIEDSKKSDTSKIDLVIKKANVANTPAKEQLNVLKKFIKDLKPVGRTLLEPNDDIAVSIVNPEKYRQEILTKISDDANKTKQTLGNNGACSTIVRGIQHRVEWDRVSVSEVMLFIRYESEIECK